MLNQISWTDYILAVVILSAVYYLFVGYKYFRADIKRLFTSRNDYKRESLQYQDGKDVGFTTNEPTTFSQDFSIEDEEVDEFAEVEMLIEEIKNLIETAAKEDLPESQTKDQLGIILKKYLSVKDSALRSSVNELIVSEFAKYAVTISEDEVDLMW